MKKSTLAAFIQCVAHCDGCAPRMGATLVCFVVQVTSPSRALVLFYDLYSDMKITYPHGLLVPVVSYELTSATRDVCR